MTRKSAGARRRHSAYQRLRDSLKPFSSAQEREHEQDQEHDEADLGDCSRGASHNSETEDASQDGDDQEDKCVI